MAKGRQLAPVDSPKEIWEAIHDSALSQQYKIIAYLLYLSAGRISEILKLHAGDITFKIDNITGTTEEIMLIRRYALKNKKKPLIETPIVVGADPYETKMIVEIKDYVQRLHRSDLLFPFVNRRKFGVYLRRKVKVYTSFKLDGEILRGEVGIHPHYLRRCRLTHLAGIYNFNEYKLVALAGWSDPRVAMKYVRLNWRQYIPKAATEAIKHITMA